MLTRRVGVGALVVAAVLSALAACQQKQEAEGGMEADTTVPGDTTAMVPAAPGAEPAPAGEAAQVSVTNTMPHPMTVKADWGQGETELGKVGPNETRTFDVSAPAGTQVTLTATDDQASHSTSGSVNVGASTPASWTIE